MIAEDAAWLAEWSLSRLPCAWGLISSPKGKPDACCMASRFCPHPLPQLDLGGRAMLAAPGTSGSSVLYLPSKTKSRVKTAPCRLSSVCMRAFLRLHMPCRTPAREGPSHPHCLPPSLSHHASDVAAWLFGCAVSSQARSGIGASILCGVGQCRAS